MRCLLRSFLPLLVAPLFTGCAGLLVKGGAETLTLQSEPAGATVLLDGTEVGVTPLVLTKEQVKEGTAAVELRMTGRQQRTFNVFAKKHNVIYFADAMLLGLPYYIADSRTKKATSFPMQEITVAMYKDVAEDVHKRDLPVVALENRLAAKTKVGKLGTEVLTTETRMFNDLAYPEQLSSTTLQGFRGTVFDAHLARPGTQKGDESLRAAKVFLKPVLLGMNAELQEMRGRVFGKMSLDMEWKFFSSTRKDSMLFSITKHTDCTVLWEYASAALDEALKDAARKLADEEGLSDRLGVEFDKGLLNSKGGELSLKEPTPIFFSGRKDMLAALVKGVVTVETEDGHGSGFLITNDGYLITNAHVVDDERKVKIRFEQGFKLDGIVEKVNHDFDVALIKVAGDELPALALGNDSLLQLGEEIFAIGTPLDEKLGQTVTRGIMSGRREFEGRHFIQTDVSINPGNSGGPLIDENGKVVGVATMKIKATGVQGIGFGVPISTALQMLNIKLVK